MPALETFLVSRFMVFTLVLARISPLVGTAPMFDLLALPRQVKVVLAVTMSLLVTPVYLGGPLPAVDNLFVYLRLLASEVLIGLLIGLGINILFSGVQVAGQIVSQLSGMSLADVFNPGFNEDSPVFSQLFYLVAIAVFVGLGGHRQMTAALLDTFAAAPPGHAQLGNNFAEVILNILSQSFALGIRAAAPLLVALLLSNLVLGLISRTLPQINVIVVGFSVNALLAMGVLVLSVGAAAWTFQQPAMDVLEHVKAALAVRS